MGLEMRHLFANKGQRGWGVDPPNNAPTLQRSGATLEGYATHKELPVEHLIEVCRLESITYKNNPAVRMPYLDEQGEVTCSRFRVSLEGKPKVVTKKGDKHTLYGRWRLEEART